MKRKKIRLNKRLDTIGKSADKLGIRVYLVGGSVRDILMKKKNLDLDIVSEGSPAVLVKSLASLWKGKITPHHRFGTYVLSLADGQHIDFATARKEKYSKSGALPEVTFSNLKEDLLRRDFSLNALAFSLNEEDKGSLIDYYKGLEDLKRKTLRVLHPKSFRDDPTRIFRMARFAGRGFNIHKNTYKMAEEGVKYIKNISFERIRQELLAILKEKDPYKSLKIIEKLGVFKKIIPEIVITPETAKIRKKKGIGSRLGFLLSELPVSEKKRVMNKLGLKKTIKREIERLYDSQDESVLISGSDLIKLGYKPGPLFKQILNSISRHIFKSRSGAIRFVIDNYPQKR